MREGLSCRSNEWVQDVWTAMKTRGLRRAPVVAVDGKPVGILYSRDVLKSLPGEVKDEEALLRHCVMIVVLALRGTPSRSTRLHTWSNSYSAPNVFVSVKRIDYTFCVNPDTSGTVYPLEFEGWGVIGLTAEWVAG